MPFHKLAFWRSANRTNPVIGQLLKGSLRRYVVFWVSKFWVVYVAADGAFPLVHFNPLDVPDRESFNLINFCCQNLRYQVISLQKREKNVEYEALACLKLAL